MSCRTTCRPGSLQGAEAISEKLTARRGAMAILAGGAVAMAMGGSARSSEKPATEKTVQAVAPGLPTGATMRLARFAADLRIGDLPGSYRSQQQLYLLDIVGSMLAGSVQPVHASVRKAMSEAVGEGTHEAIGGARMPFSAAVLLDGLSAADFEFEHVVDNAHPSSAAFPALLALAADRGIGGAEMLTAMAISYELAMRIGDACTPAVERERGFHNPGVNGTVAAAAGCARLLGLDAAGCASAMGLAGSSSAGLLAFVDTGAMTKRLHPARSCQLGLEAALMARAGVQGPMTVLEDTSGLIHAFSPKPDPSKLLQGLGTSWPSARMIIKLSPVHAYAQNFVRALNVARQKGMTWKPSEVTAVEVDASAAATAPGHMDRAPQTLVAGQYSVPFAIAIAIARDLRDPLLVDDAALSDTEVVRLMRLISFKTTGGDPNTLGGTFHITASGKPFVLDASDYPGLPGAPGYAACVSEKFDQVVAALGVAKSGPALRQAIDRIAEDGGPAVLRSELLAAGRAIARRPS